MFLEDEVEETTSDAGMPAGDDTAAATPVGDDTASTEEETPATEEAAM